MFITLDILQKRGACQEYLDFFQKHFPDGVDMLYMIEHGHVPYHGLHWGYKWLDPNEEEAAAYWKKVHVENSEGVDESDHIFNSSIIVKSSQITDCQCVIDSKEITGSRHVRTSEFVDGSSFIQNSSFIDNSTRVLNSKNVSDSCEIVDSTYIMNSHGITDSTNIVEGHTIWRSSNLTNCGFCFNCSNLINALFCLNAVSGEYLLFNKPIDKTRFEMINKQFRRYASAYPIMTRDWIENIHGASASKIMDYRKHTENIPNAFWSWVETLPGYDPMIIYSLTFNPHFLK
jgi:NDP-sugar pyrophosphorylase family protein